MMEFRSKIDPWLIALLAATAMVPLLTLAWAIRDGTNWLLPATFAAFVTGLSGWLVGTTRYTVGKDTLLVQSGPFTWRIPTNSITRIVPSRSALSSPALSLDRLCIEYDQGRKFLLVSPQDKDAFIRAVEAAKNAR